MKISELPPDIGQFLRDVWEARRSLLPTQDLYGFRYFGRDILFRDLWAEKFIGGRPQRVFRERLARKIRVVSTMHAGLSLLLGPRDKARVLMQADGDFPAYPVARAEMGSSSRTP
jgi:hypothetical protein